MHRGLVVRQSPSVPDSLAGPKAIRFTVHEPPPRVQEHEARCEFVALPVTLHLRGRLNCHHQMTVTPMPTTSSGAKISKSVQSIISSVGA